MLGHPWRFWGLFVLVGLLVTPHPLGAQVRYPLQPGPRDFILDEAELINDADREQLRATCDTLLTEERVPIIIVTIQSLANYGARGLTIEAYARSLFDTWGIGAADYNYGILLLISKDDRKARIEMGESWAHTRDADAQRIMDGIIIPNFKAGNFSSGILEGGRALDTLARGRTVKVPRPWWQPLVFFGLIGLGIGAGISLIRSGHKGWGWALLGLVGGVLVAILVGMFSGSGSRSSDSGSSYSGSSFGGGRGGGGGATGSW